MVMAFHTSSQGNTHGAFSHTSHATGKRLSNSPRFGNALSQTLSKSTPFFQWCEKTPIGALVLQDVTCFNIPTMALARSKNELLDGIPNMIGLTSITAGSSLLAPPLLRKLTAKLTHMPVAQLTAPLTEARLASMPVAEKLGRLSASFGFLFPFGAGFMAVPFFRNVLTLQRAGTSDFEHIIGLKRSSDTNPNTKPPTGKPIKTEAFYQARKRYLQGGLGILGAGIGLGAVSLLGFAHLAKAVEQKKLTIAPQGTWDKLIHQLTHTFALRGATSNAVSGLWSVLIFWLATPYLGWHLAARSKNEKIENAVKATNSILWFSMFTPMFIKGQFAKAFEALGHPTGVHQVKNPILKGLKAELPSYHAVSQLRHEAQKAAYTKLLNQYHTVSWLLPVVALSTTPQLLNIFFTKRRFEKATSQTTPTVSQGIPTPSPEVLSTLSPHLKSPLVPASFSGTPFPKGVTLSTQVSHTEP
ncbi:MAG: hypothetical protein ACKO37_02625 [Vampirovibrionales bacterium]